ncbi:MAG: hemolysin family protein [Thermomicrobiales bacterium]
MEPGSSSWYELGGAAACFLLVALTAVAEVALGQISRHNARQNDDHDRRGASTVARLLERPRAYAAALALWQWLAAIAFTILVYDLTRRAHLPGGPVSAFLIACVLLAIGREAPRAIARGNLTAAGEGLAGFVTLVTLLARPVLALHDGMTRLGQRLFRRASDGEPADDATEQELHVALGGDYGNGFDEPLEAAERKMIDAILDLEDRTARDIMVPRLDIVAVPEDASLTEVLTIIQRAGHSRVPVYRESIDQMVGMLYAKDLLRYALPGARPLPLAALIRPLDIVVPESKRIDDLLREMRQRKIHLALVADEYGGTAGVVTIEDILEEIVGEIDDEHDPATEPTIAAVNEREYVVDARVSADEVSDLLQLHWTEEEHNTLSGLVQRELGRLPAAGEELDYDGVHITVLSVEGHRLKRLLVEKRDTDEVNGGDSGEATGRLPGAAEVAK